MTPLAQRIATAVYQNSPRLLCFTCLAAQQGLKEHDVRAVALVLIVRGGLQLVRRVCFGCQRASEALVASSRVESCGVTHRINTTPQEQPTASR